MRARTGVLVVLAATLLASPATASASPDVTGYALPSTPSSVVVRDAPGLTTVTVVASSLRADGRSASTPARDAVRLLRTAHRQGLRAELLLSSWSNRLGDFDPRAARRLLRSEANVARVASRLAETVADQGWDGVNIDLERLTAESGPGLVRLAEELQARMPDERTVTVDVSARTSLAAYRRGGYRLGPLGRAVDAVQLMAYDMHGPTWSGPGPIGPLAWQRRAVGVVLQRVPRERVDLGVAGYGYTWPAASTGRTGRSVTVGEARRLVRERGGRPRWRADAGEWTARLADGTVVWWSDRRSYRQRLRLADDLGLRGVAVWRLGSADPLG